MTTPPIMPIASATGRRGAVASADQIATQAGIAVLRQGGNAVDAAIATNAAMAVVGPHLCGLGGDLFALVHVDGQTYGLNASGRAGSGSDAAAMRAEGLTAMPFRHDIRSVTVPGCVDGWFALHDRFGQLALSEVLQPAVGLATDGFTASPLLTRSVESLDAAGRKQLRAVADQVSGAETIIRLPGVARTLKNLLSGGRDAFYGGEFGAGLIELGNGLFHTADLTASHADWVTPLTFDVFGVTLATIGPNSQGYLALAGLALASQFDLPVDPDDERWAHLLIECVTAAGHDRSQQLHEGADGAALVTEIAARTALVDLEHASPRSTPTANGDTTYLCTVDGDGMGVSLIQSNAAGFGSWLAEPNTGIGLHNRGLGFSLVADHPAELGPGRRPPHTLVPMAATTKGRLKAVFGTMGGDAQPQIMMQLAARLFHHGIDPQTAVTAGRWALRAATGFDTWTGEPLTVAIEGHAGPQWAAGLAERGHTTEVTDPFSSAFGHAHAIVVDADDGLAAGYDPRTIVGSAAAF